MKKFKIGFIGAGNIATAIFNGIVNSGYITSDSVCVYDTLESKMSGFVQKGAAAETSADNVVSVSEFVFLTVKPQIYPQLLPNLRRFVADTCFVDVAAGISINYVKELLGADVPVVRVMPNTPLMFGMGASALVKAKPVTDEQFDFVQGCFNSCGVTAVVDEKFINTVTAISGSSPAFIMRFIKDMQSFAENSGMSHDDARKLILQSVKGSAVMIEQSSDDVDRLIRNVTSPNGTTEAGLKALDETDFDGSLLKCLSATVTRAEELSK